MLLTFCSVLEVAFGVVSNSVSAHDTNSSSISSILWKRMEEEVNYVPPNQEVEDSV